MRKELIKYNPELIDKKYIVVLSKADLLDEELIEEYKQEMKNIFQSIPHVIISSVTQYQLTALKDLLWKELTTSIS